MDVAKFILIMAGVFFIMCANVALVIWVLRVDYNIVPHDPVEWWQVAVGLTGIPLAALMFWAATSERKSNGLPK